MTAAGLPADVPAHTALPRRVLAGYALGSLVTGAFGTELTPDYAERTRIMSWRIAVLALAILVSGALAPLVVNATGGGRTGHHRAGLFVAALILAGTLATYVGTRHAESRIAPEPEPTLRAQLAVATGNRPFRALLFTFVTQAAGIGTMLAGVQFFADHVIGDASGATYLFAAFVGRAAHRLPQPAAAARGLTK